uniref:Uncharacterized protein n=1 Tax=Oryza punctata TaxID=4537 RepID=A0A0E0LZV2_ORYPU
MVLIVCGITHPGAQNLPRTHSALAIEPDPGRQGACASELAAYAAAGDFLPMQDGYFVRCRDVYIVVDWGTTPLGRLPTPPPGDFLPCRTATSSPTGC